MRGERRAEWTIGGDRGKRIKKDEKMNRCKIKALWKNGKGKLKANNE